MKRAARVALERAQGVEPERTAQVNDGELPRRLHARDASRHRADGIVGDGQEQQAAARQTETAACRHKTRMQGTGQATPEVAPAGDC
jgi:hypothetical protein